MASTVKYFGDGALPSATNNGGWDLRRREPARWERPVFTPVPTIRPVCLALRFPTYTTQAACEAVGTSPNNLAWTTSTCSYPAFDGNPGACAEPALPGAVYSNGKCALSLEDDDRNVASCVKAGGTWVTSGLCTGRWNPPTPTEVLTSGTGPGNECLRCHNEATQYNGVRIRDVENYLYTGHKNMSRKVTAPKPWGGPPFVCCNALYSDEQTCEDNGAVWNPTIYPSDDSGNPIGAAGWAAGQVTISGRRAQ